MPPLVAAKGRFLMKKEEFVKTIDHSLLKPHLSKDDIVAGCDVAKRFGFKLAMVQPHYVELAAHQLEGTDILVGTVVSFPHGNDLTSVKALSTRMLREQGATDLDMVMNLAAMKSKEYELLHDDIAAVVAAAGDGVVKVILETHYLDKGEIVKACEIAKKAGAHFVKTSTGFTEKGATPEDIALMRATVGPEMGVKGAGGIRTLDQALAILAAGANRVGISASESIMKEWETWHA